MSRFNLIDEHWIPVRRLDGKYEELGVKNTLLQAEDIAAIEDPSPLVVASLYRLLLAVLYRALKGPTDINQAQKFFNEGLPREEILAYLKERYERFWLFDEKYPFGQNPNTPPSSAEPWTKLTLEYNDPNNKVLFDHTDIKYPGTRSPQECARWVVSTMSFSISGGRGYSPSPSSNAMMCIPLGENLQKTLLYNLVPYQNRDVMGADLASWERDLSPDAKERNPSGYADLYTWRPRMILLEEDPSGKIKEKIRFVSGDKKSRTNNSATMDDPMLSYKTDPKRGVLPVPFKRDRETWRDFDSLLPDKSDRNSQGAKTIQHAIELVDQNVNLMPKSVLILGLKNKNAKVDFWRMEQFVLPKILADYKNEIGGLLSRAEQAGKFLWRACCVFAEGSLSRGGRKPDKSDIRHFAQQMSLTARYWSLMETRFHETLGKYNSKDIKSEKIELQWCKSIRGSLDTVWKQHHASVATSGAWTIRSLLEAERVLGKEFKKLDQEIKALED